MAISTKVVHFHYFSLSRKFVRWWRLQSAAISVITASSFPCENLQDRKENWKFCWWCGLRFHPQCAHQWLSWLEGRESTEKAIKFYSWTRYLVSILINFTSHASHTIVSICHHHFPLFLLLPLSDYFAFIA